MIVTVTGLVTDETRAAVANVTVEAYGDWLLTRRRLAKAVTDGNGRYTLKVTGVNDAIEVPSSFTVRVIDVTLRPLVAERELAGTVASHEADFVIQRADLRGPLVTGLRGVALRVSEGNALKVLIDGEETFARIADDLKRAGEGPTPSINVTQLYFAVPSEFHPDNEAIDPATGKPKERGKLVFRFLPPPLVPLEPRGPNPPQDRPRVGDERPERLILARASAMPDIKVNILLNQPAFGWPEGMLWLLGLTPLAGGVGALLVGGLFGLLGIGLGFWPIMLALTALGFAYEAYKIPRVLRGNTDLDEVSGYYKAALAHAAHSRAAIKVRGFRQLSPDNGVLHCKMVLVDGKRAIVIGSPFSQRYFDVPTHAISDPRRGGNTSDMVHDVSMAVVGPAVRDLHETFRLFWNEDLAQDAPDRVGDILTPPRETAGEDGVATVQVVRTLSGGRFAELGKRSEKGILEAYLRAFEAAQRYIYLETQYFTDSVITDALVEVLKARPHLELIVMLNIKPDVPLYPRRQAGQMERLRAAGGARVGIFTRWSYDASGPRSARPWVAPVYLHSKVGIVDDSWATVGSANLDGLSLDYNLLLSPLVVGETTAAELNLAIIPPSPGAVTPVAELLRKRLFAEHLGLLDANGQPNPNDSRLLTTPAGGWVAGLWKPHAEEALKHLKEARPAPLPGFVLAYPPDAGGLTTPRKHLAALGVELKKVHESVVRPIRSLRKFDFATGKWSTMPEIEDIER